MAINLKAYKEGDRTFVDKDPDNKWYYVIDLSDEMAINNTSLSLCTATVNRVTLLEGPTVQQGKYLVFKLTGPTAAPENDTSEASVTFHCTCANTEEFDQTVYVRGVQK